MKRFMLSVETQGMVIFDPVVLSDFIKSFSINDKDIFHFFINNPEIGDMAISNGVVLPIYPILPGDYLVKFSENPVDTDIESAFSYTNFPLKCETGTLITSDIYALIDWDDDFFRNYHAYYSDHSATNDMVQVKPGLLSATINGGWKKILPNKKIPAYEFQLQYVDVLPLTDPNKDIELYDFNLLSIEEKAKNSKMRQHRRIR